MPDRKDDKKIDVDNADTNKSNKWEKQEYIFWSGDLGLERLIRNGNEDKE